MQGFVVTKELMVVNILVFSRLWDVASDAGVTKQTNWTRGSEQKKSVI